MDNLLRKEGYASPQELSSRCEVEHWWHLIPNLQERYANNQMTEKKVGVRDTCQCFACNKMYNIAKFSLTWLISQERCLMQQQHFNNMEYPW